VTCSSLRDPEEAIRRKSIPRRAQRRLEILIGVLFIVAATGPALWILVTPSRAAAAVVRRCERLYASAKAPADSLGVGTTVVIKQPGGPRLTCGQLRRMEQRER
jgi:hypothetical protein